MPARLSLFLVFVVCALALAACGRGDSSGVDRGDPAAVNIAWVQAVRENNQEAAAALYDAGSPEANSYNVKKYLSSMGSYIYEPESNPYKYGEFKTVELLNVQDVGKGKRAFSLWVFENNSLCYYSELSQLDGSWTVTSWGWDGPTKNCGE